MKALYFDCFSGISGDMTLGALIDLGADIEVIRTELEKLQVAGYDISADSKQVNGIGGTDFSVNLHEEIGHLKKRMDHHHKEALSGHHHDHHHTHNHEHTHDHDHAHNHDHEHEESHDHAHEHRTFRDISEMITESALSETVKKHSVEIFREIAKAEAHVHQKTIEDVHFHEVGAIDSIVDIVGVCIALELLGIDRVYSSPVHDGHGFIECRHGMMPVPVPAVMEMLKDSGIPLVQEDVATELVTPTGLGILKAIATAYGPMPQMAVERTGYGFGKRQTGRFNALRVVMGTVREQLDEEDEVLVIETNIDDSTAETMGYAMDRLLAEGALDVFHTAIQMKKNRPGVLLTVICRPHDGEKMAAVLFAETSTIGVRYSRQKRLCMSREFKKVMTEYGEVTVKVASWKGASKQVPEYEDVRRLADERKVPFRMIYEAALNQKS